MENKVFNVERQVIILTSWLILFFYRNTSQSFVSLFLPLPAIICYGGESATRIFFTNFTYPGYDVRAGTIQFC